MARSSLGPRSRWPDEPARRSSDPAARQVLHPTARHAEHGDHHRGDGDARQRLDRVPRLSRSRVATRWPGDGGLAQGHEPHPVQGHDPVRLLLRPGLHLDGSDDARQPRHARLSRSEAEDPLRRPGGAQLLRLRLHDPVLGAAGLPSAVLDRRHHLRRADHRPRRLHPGVCLLGPDRGGVRQALVPALRTQHRGHRRQLGLHDLHRWRGDLGRLHGPVRQRLGRRPPRAELRRQQRRPPDRGHSQQLGGPNLVPEVHQRHVVLGHGCPGQRRRDGAPEHRTCSAWRPGASCS